MTEHAPDVRALAEAVADVLVERGLVASGATGGPARVLSVSEVARVLGRRPAWVYAHAAELGAIRFGSGPRARLGFDVAAIERWKRDQQVRPPEARRPARRTAVPRGGSLIPYEPAVEYGR